MKTKPQTVRLLASGAGGNVGTSGYCVEKR